MFKQKQFFIVFEGVEGCGKSYQTFDPKITAQLFGHQKNFNYLSKLISIDKFPKISLFSGKKE